TSVERRRVGERAGEFDIDAREAVPSRSYSRGIRELPEPVSVGAYGEDLTASGVGAERVAAGLEDDRVRQGILEDGSIVTRADRASRRIVRAKAPRADVQRPLPMRGGAPEVEVGNLAQPAAEGVDGEHLAVSLGVRPERIGRGQEERACPGGTEEPDERVRVA